MAEYIATYTCPLCGEGPMYDADMKTHMLIGHCESTISCPMCDLSGVNEQEMTLHINTVHCEDSTKITEEENDVYPSCFEPVDDDIILCTNFDTEKSRVKQTKSKISLLLSSPSQKADPVRIGRTSCSEGSNIIGTNNHSSNKISSYQNSSSVDLNEQHHHCPICGMQVKNDEITSHVEDHFREEDMLSNDMALAQHIQQQEKMEREKKEKKEFEMLQAMYGMDNKGNFREQSAKNIEKAVWKGEIDVTSYHQQQIEMKSALHAGIDDGRSSTDGIIAQLASYYSGSVYGIKSSRLCNSVSHFSSSYGDHGWGCGYRNLQMILSSMVQQLIYKDTVFNGRNVIPSIPKIQDLIENAWKKGFDIAGCEQLGGKLCNTRKWIGATEIVTLLSSLHVSCKLIDFHCPSSMDGTHPQLFDWVRKYYDEMPLRTPLYLQHQGHSRTIIGYEEQKNSGIKLLLFDPSHTRRQMKEFISGSITGKIMHLLRKSLTSLKASQYQIVVINGIMDDSDYERSKVVRSTRIP